MSTLMSSSRANVYGFILPIFELSSIMYTDFALWQMSLHKSASICVEQENPLSGVNAAAESTATSKLLSVKYTEASDEAVERFSFMSTPPKRLMETFFFLASSVATASPLVNTL